MPIKKSLLVFIISGFLSAGAINETCKIIKTLNVFDILFEQEKPPFTLWVWLIIALLSMTVAYISFKITSSHHSS